MTQETLNVLQQITLQVALIVGVVALWFELRREREKRDAMINQAAGTLTTLAASQVELAKQITEQQRLVINLMRDRDGLDALPAKLPGE